MARRHPSRCVSGPVLVPQIPRPVKRQVSFTEDEFDRLRRRARSSNRTFAGYVREAALGQRVVIPSRGIPHRVLFELNRWGNEFTRLARAADAAGAFTAGAELGAALAEHRRVMAALHAALRALPEVGPDDGTNAVSADGPQ